MFFFGTTSTTTTTIAMESEKALKDTHSKAEDKFFFYSKYYYFSQEQRRKKIFHSVEATRLLSHEFELVSVHTQSITHFFRIFLSFCFSSLMNSCCECETKFLCKFVNSGLLREISAPTRRFHSVPFLFTKLVR